MISILIQSLWKNLRFANIQLMVLHLYFLTITFSKVNFIVFPVHGCRKIEGRAQFFADLPKFPKILKEMASRFIFLKDTFVLFLTKRAVAATFYAGNPAD